MPPTTTQEEGADGSLPTAASPLREGLAEPPTSSRKRRARVEAADEGSMAVGKGRPEDASRTTSDSPGQELDAAAQASPSAVEQPKKEQSKKPKWVMAADEGCVGEDKTPRRSKRRSMTDPEAEAAVASASTATEQASDASSVVSSPIRRPYFKRAVTHVDEWGDETLEPLSNIDAKILDVYEEHNAKYSAKQRKHLKLITLERVPHSCLDNPWFGLTRDSAAETVLRTAKVVLGLSSYIDGKLLKRASGFIIDWDKESKMATVLTSTLLICTSSTSLDEWLAKDEYGPHAEVHVDLMDKDDTIATAELVHYHKHYNFALFKVKMDLIAQIPSFSTEVKYGQELFVLGRDEGRHLIVDHGSVLHKGPSSFERHHNMFTGCKVNECCLGGPVIELNGPVLGMISLPEMTFIPSVIILKCLHMLKKYNCVPRLHTGMKFSAIRFLDPVHREKISRKCNIDAGLIVTEVSGRSIAEKAGIRIGDIVEYLNGELVCTTFELENLLLQICGEHLDNGDGLGSTVEVPVGIYRVRKDSRSTVILKLKVRDDVEVIAKGEYDVSTVHSAMVSQDDRGSGQEEPHGTDKDEDGGS